MVILRDDLQSLVYFGTPFDHSEIVLHAFFRNWDPLFASAETRSFTCWLWVMRSPEAVQQPYLLLQYNLSMKAFTFLEIALGQQKIRLQDHERTFCSGIVRNNDERTVFISTSWFMDYWTLATGEDQVLVTDTGVSEHIKPPGEPIAKAAGVDGEWLTYGKGLWTLFGWASCFRMQGTWNTIF